MKNENRIRLIAIRPITPENVSGEEMTSALAIQKKIAGSDWLYFHQRYKLLDIRTAVNNNEKNNYGACLAVKPEAYQDELLFNESGTLGEEQDLCINISAIVGSNGSGKSSTVDLLIRIINNFAAAYIGEGYRNAASDHLYFIENVYGALVVELGASYYIIEVQGRSVKIGQYSMSEDGTYKTPNRIELIDSLTSSNDSALKGYGKHVFDLAKFFYTTVYNYSMYAFNYLDFYAERTVEDRWESKKNRHERALKEGLMLPTDDYCQEDVWLNGLFHKNDGYQVPIVLNPLREEGVIDIPNENKLARERLLSMLFYTSSKERELNVEHRLPTFPFRTINENLYVVELCFKEYEQPTFSRDNVLKKLGLDKRTHLVANFDQIKMDLINEWQKVFQFIREEESEADTLAWDYVVYKTLKISKNYNLQYQKILKNLSSADYSRTRLGKHIQELAEDDSHITLKLRRALYYLKFKLYGDELSKDHNIDDVFLKIQDVLVNPSNAIYRIKKSHLYAIMPKEIELAPPPIFNINYKLVDKKYIESDGSYTRTKLFPMEGLSSGERQVAYSISNLAYHIVNLDSVWECGQENVNAESAEDPEDRPEKRIYYKYVNVIFDEVELYFHPDLQRRYVSSLISALHDIRLQHIKGISILMVTHSPFVLSDIPRSNILFLGGKRDDIKETFSANLHDILNSHFFMDFSIGEHARATLNQLLSLYNDFLKRKNVKKIWLKNEKKFSYLKSIVGDKYLQSEVNRIYERLLRQYGSEEELLLKKNELEQQLKSIMKLLK